jgi:hypothetical protein
MTPPAEPSSSACHVGLDTLWAYRCQCLQGCLYTLAEILCPEA